MHADYNYVVLNWIVAQIVSPAVHPFIPTILRTHYTLLNRGTANDVTYDNSYIPKGQVDHAISVS